MYTLEFTLRQHTPLIHFQHDQEGATLRATEVKPKLDRFLKDKYQHTHTHLFYDNSQGGHYMKYKLSILCEKAPKIELINASFPCFFAAMGEEYQSNYKCFSFTDKSIYLLFQCYEKVTLDLIELEISNFLCVTNFGTRQSKGFGSFYIDKDDKHYRNPSEIITNALHYIVPNYDIKSVFTDIETIYKIMKSGFNFPDHKEYYEQNKKRIDYNVRNHRGYAIYIKSFLVNYFLSQQIGNEKRFIKENFFSSQVRLPNDGLNKKYVRALLGTTDMIEFRGKDRKGKVLIKSDTVERYKSPIFFKIIEKEVFILLINQSLPESSFRFTHTFKDKEDSRIIKSPIFQLFGSDFLKKFGEYFEMEKSRVLKEINTFRGTPPNVVTQLRDSLKRINLVCK